MQANKVNQVGAIYHNGKTHQTDAVIYGNGISPTILGTIYKNTYKYIFISMKKYRVRKLTPKECYRLMGFTDLDFFKAKTASAEDAEKLVKLDELTATIEAEKLYKQRKNLGCSNSQLYKQAGNSIVVDCLLNGIFKPLKETNPDLFENLKVGSFFSGIGAFEKALTRLLDD